jgi:nitrate reductase NapA
MLKDGKLKCYWTSTTNNMQAGPNINEEIYPGLAQPGGNFIVVSDVYPTVSALAADLILPRPCGPRRKAPSATPSGAPSSGASRSRRRARRKSDLWQYMEFSKRFKVEEVWPAELLAKKPEYKGKTLYDVLYAKGGQQVPEERAGQDQRSRHQELHQRRIRSLRLLRAEGPVRGIRDLRPRPWPRPGAFRRVSQGARPALAGGGRQGDPVALPRGLRPLRQGRRGREVLRHKDGKAVIFALPYQAPRARTRSSTCGCAPAACWSTGTPAP